MSPPRPHADWPSGPPRWHPGSAIAGWSARHLRDGSELVLAACRPLQRRQPKPGGEVPPGAEALRRRHQGGDRSRCDRADAGDRHEPPRDEVGLGTPGNLTIELLELLF